MMIKTKEDAKKAISEVHPDVRFWLCDGTTLKSLQELHDALAIITDEAYVYHANDDRNDFANWVNDILDDEVLARKLIGKNKKEALAIVDERIVWLKKKAK
jgi:hypothetical protein